MCYFALILFRSLLFERKQTSATIETWVSVKILLEGED